MNECYKCKYRRELIGDCHSQCVHPRRPKLGGVLTILGGMIGANDVIGVPPEEAIHVTGSAHGIRSGWFMWPVNFDPVWLESCDGFEPTEGI